MEKVTYWSVKTNGAGYIAPYTEWARTKEDALRIMRAAERADEPVAHSVKASGAKAAGIEAELKQQGR